MIHELYANKSSFKKIQFNKGINIILAEGDDNTENSRNGLGKTTLVHIIHFCLGGTPNKKYLPEDTFNDWEFTISIDISNEKIYAKRSFNEKSIIIVEGNFSKFPLKPTYSEEKEIYFYTLNEWKEVLGTSLLGLKNEKEFRFKPTFRKVISYFIRRDEDIKKSPFKTSSTHKNIDVIDCTSFCVGLDWKLMSKYKEYGDEIKRLNENFSNLKSIHGSKGQLVPEMNRLKKDLTKIKEDLDNYKVHESYRQIEKSADILSKEIQELVEKTIFLNKKIDIYEESIKEENIDDINVEEIYNEINFYFPEDIHDPARRQAPPPSGFLRAMPLHAQRCRSPVRRRKPPSLHFQPSRRLSILPSARHKVSLSVILRSPPFSQKRDHFLYKIKQPEDLPSSVKAGDTNHPPMSRSESAAGITFPLFLQAPFLSGTPKKTLPSFLSANEIPQSPYRKPSTHLPPFRTPL